MSDNLSIHMTIIYSKVQFFIDCVTFDPIYLWYILLISLFLQYTVDISNRYLISDDLSINMTI